MTTDATPFEIGRAQTVWRCDSPAAGIIATGALLYKALLAAKSLQADGIDVDVMNLSTIKPLDEKSLVSFPMRNKRIVTVEEHQIRCGMGSAVAECLVQHHPVPMAFVGVDDVFGQSGTPDELIEHYGMASDSIVAAVQGMLGG